MVTGLTNNCHRIPWGKPAPDRFIPSVEGGARQTRPTAMSLPSLPRPDKVLFKANDKPEIKYKKKKWQFSSGKHSEMQMAMWAVQVALACNNRNCKINLKISTFSAFYPVRSPVTTVISQVIFPAPRLIRFITLPLQYWSGSGERFKTQ